jgi:KTSC domain-containing protein
MDRTPIASTVITSLGYDPFTNMLEVEFRSGRIYQYLRVPPAVHAALLRAESIGSYFNRRIRDQYPDREIFEERDDKLDSRTTDNR